MSNRTAKREYTLEMLSKSASVFLRLDPRHGSVVVPPQFKRQIHLTLEIGLDMPNPIPDLKVGKKGIRCTLSFNHTPFFCILPWKSIFAVQCRDHHGMVWEEDAPAELKVRRPSNDMLN